MKQLKKQLKQLRTVTAQRTIGFAAAVEDLGTHTICGREVPYGVCQVRKVLKGQHQSERLLITIAHKRPDLFGLWFVADAVKAWWESFRAKDGAARNGKGDGAARNGTGDGAARNGKDGAAKIAKEGK